MRRALAAASAVLLLAACGGDDAGGGGSGGGTSGGGSGGTTATTVALASRVETFPVTGQAHVQGRVSYPQTPPVGGDHNGLWQNCGFYSAPVVSELAVHSMEHGAAWITFRPSLPASQVQVLRQLARERYVLVSPWADDSLPAPVVASAWGLQLKAETAADPAVAAFVAMYANGPQTPEKGASCSGAFGTPE